MLEDLQGKVAIVTGGRKGMGREHCLELTKQGVKVVVADLSQEDSQKVVDEIEQQGGEAMAVKCDVSEKQDVDNMIEGAVENFGKLDILVNNAGVADFKPFLEISEEDWDKTMEVNLKGYFLCAQAAAKQMSQQGGGSIINIASIAMGQVGVGFENLAHYTATKGGIVGMTETMAQELASSKIRVNAISPGIIETKMIEPLQGEAKEGLLARIPMGRTGNPEEISKMVVFLASEDSSYMTGSDVVVDGGWLST